METVVEEGCLQGKSDSKQIGDFTKRRALKLHPFNRSRLIHPLPESFKRVNGECVPECRDPSFVQRGGDVIEIVLLSIKMHFNAQERKSRFKSGEIDSFASEQKRCQVVDVKIDM